MRASALPARVAVIAVLLTTCAGATATAAFYLARSPEQITRSDNRPARPQRAEAIRKRHLPNIALRTHEGRAVRFYDDLVKGRYVVINFMYTSCLANCPIATANLVEVQRALEQRHPGTVRFLSISLNPEFDTPEILAEHAVSQRTGPGWLFLTGDRHDIEQLRRSLGAYELDPDVDADPSQHTGLAIIGNEPYGRWKAIPAAAHPVRVRQAIERVMLPVNEWATGHAAITEVAAEERDQGRARVSEVGSADVARYLELLANR